MSTNAWPTKLFAVLIVSTVLLFSAFTALAAATDYVIGPWDKVEIYTVGLSVSTPLKIGSNTAPYPLSYQFSKAAEVRLYYGKDFVEQVPQVETIAFTNDVKSALSSELRANERPALSVDLTKAKKTGSNPNPRTVTLSTSLPLSSELYEPVTITIPREYCNLKVETDSLSKLSSTSPTDTFGYTFPQLIPVTVKEDARTVTFLAQGFYFDHVQNAKFNDKVKKQFVQTEAVNQLCSGLSFNRPSDASQRSKATFNVLEQKSIATKYVTSWSVKVNKDKSLVKSVDVKYALREKADFEIGLKAAVYDAAVLKSFGVDTASYENAGALKQTRVQSKERTAGYNSKPGGAKGYTVYSMRSSEYSSSKLKTPAETLSWDVTGLEENTYLLTAYANGAIEKQEVLDLNRVTGGAAPTTTQTTLNAKDEECLDKYCFKVTLYKEGGNNIQLTVTPIDSTGRKGQSQTVLADIGVPFKAGDYYAVVNNFAKDVFVLTVYRATGSLCSATLDATGKVIVQTKGFKGKVSIALTPPARTEGIPYDSGLQDVVLGASGGTVTLSSGALSTALNGNAGKTLSVKLTPENSKNSFDCGALAVTALTAPGTAPGAAAVSRAPLTVAGYKLYYNQNDCLNAEADCKANQALTPMNAYAQSKKYCYETYPYDGTKFGAGSSYWVCALGKSIETRKACVPLKDYTADFKPKLCKEDGVYCRSMACGSSVSRGSRSNAAPKSSETLVGGSCPVGPKKPRGGYVTPKGFNSLSFADDVYGKVLFADSPLTLHFIVDDTDESFSVKHQLSISSSEEADNFNKDSADGFVLADVTLLDDSGTELYSLTKQQVIADFSEKTFRVDMPASQVRMNAKLKKALQNVGSVKWMITFKDDCAGKVYKSAGTVKVKADERSALTKQVAEWANEKPDEDALKTLKAHAKFAKTEVLDSVTIGTNVRGHAFVASLSQEDTDALLDAGLDVSSLDYACIITYASGTVTNPSDFGFFADKGSKKDDSAGTDAVPAMFSCDDTPSETDYAKYFTLQSIQIKLYYSGVEIASVKTSDSDAAKWVNMRKDMYRGQALQLKLKEIKFGDDATDQIGLFLVDREGKDATLPDDFSDNYGADKTYYAKFFLDGKALSEKAFKYENAADGELQFSVSSYYFVTNPDVKDAVLGASSLKAVFYYKGAPVNSVSLSGADYAKFVKYLKENIPPFKGASTDDRNAIKKALVDDATEALSLDAFNNHFDVNNELKVTDKDYKPYLDLTSDTIQLVDDAGKTAQITDWKDGGIQIYADKETDLSKYYYASFDYKTFASKLSALGKTWVDKFKAGDVKIRWTVLVTKASGYDLGEGEFVFDSDSPTDHEIEFTDEVKANVLRELSFKIEAGGATTYGKCEFDWKDSASSSDDYNVVFKGIGADTRADQSVVRLIFMNAENNGFIGAAKNVLITYSAEKGYRTVTVDFGEYKGSLPRENGIALPAKMKLYFDKKDAQNEYDVKATQNCVWNKDLVAD